MGDKKSKKSKYTAATADKHHLYQLSVQEPEFEVDFITRVFRKARGRKPLTMREDFCGTALFSAAWVDSRKGRLATGIDIDQPTLDWGNKHNVAPLDDKAERVTLLRQDVRDEVEAKFDVCVAFNFSYWCFQERDVLRGYFEAVRKTLVEDGMFFLDAYGGYDSHQPGLQEPRKIKQGFTYVWDQAKVDPINNTLVNHIHFEFKDKSKLKKAFTYEWRFWSLREIQELLTEAGFKNVTVYWEGATEDGDGNGVFRPRSKAVNEAGWIAYISAQP